jgi:hypothetical protein
MVELKVKAERARLMRNLDGHVTGAAQLIYERAPLMVVT